MTMHLPVVAINLLLMTTILSGGGCGHSRTAARATTRPTNSETGIISTSTTRPTDSDMRLISAICDNKPDLALSLIRAGANPNAVDPLHGSPALCYAAEEGHCMIAVVQALVERGANVKAADRAHETPLHRACMSACPIIVAYLLSKGADVSARTQSGDTPLHIAAGSGRFRPQEEDQIVRLLLEHGADVNALNSSGETPLDLAMEEQFTDMAALLKEHGAKSGSEIRLKH